MQMNESSFSPEQLKKSGDAFAGFLTTLVYSWGYVPEAILHRRLGHAYVDSHAPLAFLVMSAYAFLWEGYDLRPHFGLIVVFALFNATHRMGCMMRRWRGELLHSRYTGWPRLMWLMPRMDEQRFKRWFEPVIVIAVGAATCPLDVPVGIFVIVSGILLAAKNGNDWDREYQRVVRTNDSMIDCQLAMERFRGMSGGIN